MKLTQGLDLAEKPMGRKRSKEDGRFKKREKGVFPEKGVTPKWGEDWLSTRREKKMSGRRGQARYEMGDRRRRAGSRWVEKRGTGVERGGNLLSWRKGLLARLGRSGMIQGFMEERMGGEGNSGGTGGQGERWSIFTAEKSASRKQQ